MFAFPSDTSEIIITPNLGVRKIGGIPLVKATDRDGNTRELTSPEIVEHELGHASDQVGLSKTKVGNENTGIKWENEYRQKKGIDFKRSDPNHARK